MPKEFSQWVAEMAGTIEDASHFIKPCSCGSSSIKKNPLFIRMLMADLLVPNVNDEESLFDWLVVIRMGLVGSKGDKGYTYLSLYDLLPDNLAREYYDLGDWDQEKAWYLALRAKIIAEGL